MVSIVLLKIWRRLLEKEYDLEIINKDKTKLMSEIIFLKQLWKGKSMVGVL